MQSLFGDPDRGRCQPRGADPAPHRLARWVCPGAAEAVRTARQRADGDGATESRPDRLRDGCQLLRLRDRGEDHQRHGRPVDDRPRRAGRRGRGRRALSHPAHADLADPEAVPDREHQVRDAHHARAVDACSSSSASGIYAERYLLQSAEASAPLLEFRQLGADLYVHAVELEDARPAAACAAVKRHAEHLINLIEGAAAPLRRHRRQRPPRGPRGRHRSPRPLDAVAAVGGGPRASESRNRARTTRSYRTLVARADRKLRRVRDGPCRQGDPRSWRGRPTRTECSPSSRLARAAGVVQAPSLALPPETPGER